MLTATPHWLIPLRTVYQMILTQVEHGGDKAPSDDKLAALEELLQPLFTFFAQFSHVFIGCRHKRYSQGQETGSDAEETVMMF